MYEHKVYKIENGENLIVFIPTLLKIYQIDKKQSDSISNFILSDEPHPPQRWEDLNDYTFFRTNLILTNSCNLSCVYCYADCGPKNKLIMKKEIAVSAIDYIINCAEKNNRDLIYANMFGGEPTLAWDTMIVAVNYLRKRAKEINCRSRASMTTNGFMNLSKARWLASNLDSINISFDGFKKIQDAHRSNSFDRVFETAKEIYKIAPDKLKFRATVSEFSVNSLPEIVKFLGENFPGCNQMYEPLFTMGRGENGTYSMPNHKKFFEKYLESLPVAESLGCKLKTSVLNLGSKIFEFCGVASHNFMVTPDGRCTVCNRMSNNSNETERSFSYGSFDAVDNIWKFDDKKYQNLKKLSTRNINEECKNCFAFPSCRGDCVANKANLNPENFWETKSYRCKEIKEFVKNVLIYLLNKNT